MHRYQNVRSWNCDADGPKLLGRLAELPDSCGVGFRVHAWLDVGKGGQP